VLYIPNSVVTPFSSRKFEKGARTDLPDSKASRPGENEGLEKIQGKNVKPTLQDGPGATFRRVPAILTLGFFKS
jgi:hypothetical protein